MKSLRIFAVSLIIYLSLTTVFLQCSNSKNSNVNPSVKEKSVSETPESKLSSAIKEMLTKLEAKGVTANNVQEFDTESLSTSLMKVDGQGNIQTYIYLTEVEDEIIQELESNEVRIELINKEWRLIQAWIPFYRIKEVAKLNSVKSIKQPDYAKTFSK
jgi:uncharacterized membrane protein